MHRGAARGAAVRPARRRRPALRPATTRPWSPSSRTSARARAWACRSCSRGASGASCSPRAMPGDQPYGPEDLDFALAVAGQIAAGAAQVQHLERVARLAYTDQLTGLANRRAIDDRLDAAIVHHRELGTTVSLVIADVNGLKRINDDRGHEAGDRALVHFAGLLSASAGLVPGQPRRPPVRRRVLRGHRGRRRRPRRVGGRGPVPPGRRRARRGRRLRRRLDR